MKNQCFLSDLGPQSVLGLSWAHFGCSWELFGWSWELLGSSRWLLNYFKNDSGSILGFFLSSSLSFFSLLHPLAASKWFFIFFWGLFFSSWSVSRSILISQDDRPTLKNIDFSPRFWAPKTFIDWGSEVTSMTMDLVVVMTRNWHE